MARIALIVYMLKKRKMAQTALAELLYLSFAGLSSDMIRAWRHAYAPKNDIAQARTEKSKFNEIACKNCALGIVYGQQRAIIGTRVFSVPNTCVKGCVWYIATPTIGGMEPLIINIVVGVSRPRRRQVCRSVLVTVDLGIFGCAILE